MRGWWEGGGRTSYSLIYQNSNSFNLTINVNSIIVAKQYSVKSFELAISYYIYWQEILSKHYKGVNLRSIGTFLAKNVSWFYCEYFWRKQMFLRCFSFIVNNSNVNPIFNLHWYFYRVYFQCNIWLSYIQYNQYCLILGFLTEYFWKD